MTSQCWTCFKQSRVMHRWTAIWHHTLPLTISSLEKSAGMSWEGSQQIPSCPPMSQLDVCECVGATSSSELSDWTLEILLGAKRYPVCYCSIFLIVSYRLPAWTVFKTYQIHVSELFGPWVSSVTRKPFVISYACTKLLDSLRTMHHAITIFLRPKLDLLSSD